MRYSQALISTRKETPVDAELPSHRLMLRAGYIEQLTAGIYTLMPLAFRCVKKIETIVREELDATGAQELLLPMVQPADIWKLSGRWDRYGKELLRFKDRKEQDYCLSPTHEEGITDLAKRHIRSYRNMPVNLYQIQVKFRDELRPRAGLMRGREFLMKDAYSFDVDTSAAELSYQKMYDAYTRIFTRCGLKFRPVQADSGNIGGAHSHEFQVLAQTGEDKIIACSACGYAANEEKAAPRRAYDIQNHFTPDTSVAATERVHTPDARSIDDVSAFLNMAPERFIKTLIYLADGKPVAALMQGNDGLNEVKLQGLIGCETLVMAPESIIREATGCDAGFAGPCGLKIPIYADFAVAQMHDAVTGANEAQHHLIHVEAGRDFNVTAMADLVLVKEGDACTVCGEKVEAFRGIEVGHVFLLGTNYSEPMGATYLDNNGEAHPCVMGCYGIGITRVLAAAIEQHHDEDGIDLPVSIAPYHVILAPLQLKSDDVLEATETIYRELQAAGIEVLLDDRDIRPGVKFKDDDLLGIPYRITVGQRTLAEGQVEFKHRKQKDPSLVALSEITAHVRQQIDSDLKALDAV